MLLDEYCQLEFRPSERRRMEEPSPAYKHFTPTGLPLGHMTWLVYSKKSAQEDKKLTICFTEGALRKISN